MKALGPTRTFAHLAQATSRFGTKAKNNCDVRPSADAHYGSQALAVAAPRGNWSCCRLFIRQKLIHIFSVFSK